MKCSGDDRQRLATGFYSLSLDSSKLNGKYCCDRLSAN